MGSTTLVLSIVLQESMCIHACLCFIGVFPDQMLPGDINKDIEMSIHRVSQHYSVPAKMIVLMLYM